jgi:hypothetical protein
MRLQRQALFLANVQLGQGSPEARTILTACDRLNGILATLDSKSSVLLRVNAMVVAALAYVLIINGSDLLQVGNATLRLLGIVVGHASLIATIASCCFAFPVINIEGDFFGISFGDKDGGPTALDEELLARKSSTVARKVWFYGWAWRLAVLGGVGFSLLALLATLHVK